MRIALDAGHGYRADLALYEGAHGHNLQEDVWVLGFAQRLGHYLRARGAETVFTRGNARSVGLGTRGAVARRARCDLFVSLHLNGHASQSANGAEVLVAKGDERSRTVAARVLRCLATMGMRPRGVKWDDEGKHRSLRVLRDTCHSMTSILVEVGHLSNANDAKRLKDRVWCERLAALMAQALIAA